MSWIDNYRSKLVSADEAVRVIKSGDGVYIHPGVALPDKLVKAMIDRAPELEDVLIYHILTIGNADYVKPGMENSFKHFALFTGANTREAVSAGRAEYTPVHLSEMPRLYRRGVLKVNVAMLHLSPPDEHGFCSLGVDVETAKSAAESADTVIAQINPNMPRTLGDCFIHVNKLKYCVEVEDELPEMPEISTSDIHDRIGMHIADMIEDGSTLQMGIGAIPDAVLKYLDGKKDLGVHTEMFSDGVIELIENGIINNEKKTLHQGKSVSTFVLGSKKLYSYIHNNPIFEFRPTEYVNDPFVIGQNNKMVAINSAIEVDLTGQVCSDSIGYNIYSGFGGQVDFIRGAARTEGGLPFIALPAAVKVDKYSRIVPHLKEGAGVVTSRADVHYVVTEFGVAYLHGKGLRQRAKALIKIAHPKFRDELEAEARKHNWI